MLRSVKLSYLFSMTNASRYKTTYKPPVPSVFVVSRQTCTEGFLHHPALPMPLVCSHTTKGYPFSKLWDSRLINQPSSTSVELKTSSARSDCSKSPISRSARRSVDNPRPTVTTSYLHHALKSQQLHPHVWVYHKNQIKESGTNLWCAPKGLEENSRFLVHHRRHSLPARQQREIGRREVEK